VHIWFTYDNSSGQQASFGIGKELTNGVNQFPRNITKWFNQTVTSQSIGGTTYYLVSELINFSTTPLWYDENDIYDYSFKMRGGAGGNSPSIKNHKNASSFVLINVPSNATLTGLDSDSDGMNDFQELYGNFTDPFFNDTDNDGVTDQCDGDPLNPAITSNSCAAAITVIFGPPSTTSFIINQNATGAMCGPDDISFWVEPENQTSSLGIYNATNSGSITGNFQARLSGTQNTGWILMLSNSSSTTNVVNLTTSWKTIWYSVSAGQTKQIWSYTNCSNVNIGTGVEFQFQAT